MSPIIRRRQGVDNDIAELAGYLLDRSEVVAIRFVDAIETTLKGLAQTPGIGSPKFFKDARLTGIRSWFVQGFPNHFIFDQPIENGIMVLAVLHGARDLNQVLEQRM